MQKSEHFYFSCENINIKQEILEIDYDNDQCEILEHQIDKPDLFHIFI